MVFFNMVKAASNWDFDHKSKFKVLESEHDVECDEWNAECTLKLEEVVAQARLHFKCQSSLAAVAVKDNPFEEWLVPRNVTLRPLYWEISSHAYSNFKKLYKEAKSCTGKNTRRNVLECGV